MRPKIKDFFGENTTLQEVMQTYHSQPQLFNYAQALDWHIDALDKAIVSLTPGGSEFVEDADYCVKYVKEFQAAQHRMILDLVKEKNQLKDALKEFLKVITELQRL